MDSDELNHNHVGTFTFQTPGAVPPNRNQVAPAASSGANANKPSTSEQVSETTHSSGKDINGDISRNTENC